MGTSVRWLCGPRARERGTAEPVPPGGWGTLVPVTSAATSTRSPPPSRPAGPGPGPPCRVSSSSSSRWSGPRRGHRRPADARRVGVLGAPRRGCAARRPRRLGRPLGGRAGCRRGLAGCGGRGPGALPAAGRRLDLRGRPRRSPRRAGRPGPRRGGSRAPPWHSRPSRWWSAPCPPGPRGLPPSPSWPWRSPCSAPVSRRSPAPWRCGGWRPSPSPPSPPPAPGAPAPPGVRGPAARLSRPGENPPTRNREFIRTS